jgi:hypothetical protein
MRKTCTVLSLAVVLAVVTANTTAQQKKTGKAVPAPKAAGKGLPTTCPGGAAPQFPNPIAAPIDASCGLPGSAVASSAEGLQNATKNNFCAQGDPATVSTKVMADLQASVDGIAGFPHGTPPPSRAALLGLGEGNLVVFEGFLFDARQECAESVNCGAVSPNVNASHDIHIALLDTPRKTKETDPPAKRDAEECTGFVAEMIPHHRPAQWTECSLKAVRDKGLRVKIQGQRLFDGSHVPCKNGAPQGSNPKRISLWEIHPIYSFEVCPTGDCKAGGWISLETFAKDMPTCPEKKCEVKPAAGK